MASVVQVHILVWRDKIVILDACGFMVFLLNYESNLSKLDISCAILEQGGYCPFQLMPEVPEVSTCVYN